MEIRERAGRLVLEHLDEYPSQWVAISSVATKCGMTPEMLRKWVRRTEADGGARPSRAGLAQADSVIRDVRQGLSFL